MFKDQDYVVNAEGGYDQWWIYRTHHAGKTLFDVASGDWGEGTGKSAESKMDDHIPELINKFIKSCMTGTVSRRKDRWYLRNDVIEIPTTTGSEKDLEDAVYKQQKISCCRWSKESSCCTKPVLVGTITIEVSELLSGMLKKKESNNVLNAKYHEQEAEIVADAGVHLRNDRDEHGRSWYGY